MAADLRKREPHLTKEQAFAKVYTDPANVDLRRAERNFAYGAIGYGYRYEEPARKTISPAESGVAYQAIMKMAAAAHKKDPGKTIEQHFAAIYSSDESLRRLDISERNVAKAYPPVARTKPVIAEGDGYAELRRMAEEIRRENPEIPFSVAFARGMTANPDAARREKKERYARMGVSI
jgi:hypothetical protein